MSNYVTTGPDGRSRVDRSALVENIFSEVTPLYRNAALSQAARDAFDDARAAIREHVAAGEQHQADVEELRSKRDMIPQAGFERLEREANEAARSSKQAAGWRFDRSVGELEARLLDDVIPTFEPSRESLARQELAIALGEAKGPELKSRVLALVRSGSPEALAMAVRDRFGQTLMKARGLDGRDLDDTLKQARKVAADVALERGTSERERAAAKALQRLGTLKATRGAAGQ